MPEDRFASHSMTRTSPGLRHWPIVPHNTNPLDPKPRVIYAATAGVAMLRDAAGVQLGYALAAGDILPFSANGISATGTTATLYGWD